ncbi:MAG: winged helix-turn-helix domain-containing protein [Pseudomonadota bacterium]
MVYRFADFVFYRERRSLSRAGTVIRISSKQFSCLCYFLENTGRAIPRDDLIFAVWRHHHVTDNQLAQLILSLRRLLGGSVQSQACIRTVPGYGYEWILDVQQDEGMDPLPEQDAPEIEPLEDRPPPVRHHHSPRSGRLRVFAPIAVLALLLVVSSASIWPLRKSAERAIPSQPAMPTVGATELTVLLRKEKFTEIEQIVASLPEATYRSDEIQLFLLDLDIARNRYAAGSRRLELLRSRVADTAGAMSAKFKLRDAQICASTRETCDNLDEKMDLAVTAAAGLEPPASNVPLAEALLFRASVLGMRGDQTRARADIGQAKRISVKNGDSWLAGASDLMLARTWMMDGRFEAAEEDFLRAADDSEKTQYYGRAKIALVRAARVQAAMLKWREALKTLDRASAINADIDYDRPFQLRALFLQRLGRSREAMMALDAAQSRDKDISAKTLLLGSKLALDRGEYDFAASQAALAFKKFGKKAEPDILFDNRSGAALTLATAQLRSRAPLDTALPEDFESSLYADESIPGLIARGHWARLSGNPHQADELYRAALRLAFEQRNTFAIAEATKAAAALSVSEKKYADAARFVASLDSWEPEVWERDASLCTYFDSLLQDPMDELADCSAHRLSDAKLAIARAP